MFLITMFRVGGWKGLLAAIVLGVVFKIAVYGYIFHQTSSMLMAAQPDSRTRSAFALGIASGGRPPADDSTSTAYRSDVPASSWVSYAEDDPATGAHVFHARISADPAPIDGPPSRLELAQGPGKNGEAMLTLGAVPAAACAGIVSVDAIFDRHPARSFSATAQPQDGSCAVAITNFAAFRNAVRYAGTLQTTPGTAAGPLSPVRWHVAGLAWGGD